MLRRLSSGMRLGYLVRTWHIEMAIVATVLTVVVVVSDKGPVEWIGSLAVLLTFAHVQVADRLAEQADLEERNRGQATVECYWKLKWYLVGKEVLWLAYFVMLGAWSALVGVALFLLYPLWRHWYRRRYPVGRVEDHYARREQAQGPS